MRIATWNVNSIRARIEHVVSFLQQYNIDVMLLQELKCAKDLFPSQIFEDLGYNCAIYCQKAYNGVAILSKNIIEDIVDGSSIFQNDDQTRYIEAFTGGLTVASVYVPNGQDRVNVESGVPYAYKLDFMKKLQGHILSQGYAQNNFVIGGDFNITRDDQDTYDPKIWNETRIACTKPERQAINEFINQLSLDDAMRKHGCCDFTWYDYRHNSVAENRGLRIDYILTSQKLQTVSCITDISYRKLQRASDHVPVISDIAEDSI